MVGKSLPINNLLKSTLPQTDRLLTGDYNNWGWVPYPSPNIYVTIISVKLEVAGRILQIIIMEKLGRREAEGEFESRPMTSFGQTR